METNNLVNHLLIGISKLCITPIDYLYHNFLHHDHRHVHDHHDHHNLHDDDHEEKVV